MFVDDCLIFYRMTRNAARSIEYILDHYCRVSGQLFNYKKSKVQFSKGINKELFPICGNQTFYLYISLYSILKTKALMND